MNDRYKIDKLPSQGMNTLVSQLSLLQLDRIVTDLQDLRERGESESGIRTVLDRRYGSLDSLTRKKLYQLSLGLIPRDDFDESELGSLKEINTTTLELNPKRIPEEVQEGSLIYFRRTRWLVVSLTGSKMTLKRL